MFRSGCSPSQVRFALDRAGLVGADGATHSGFADVTYMGVLPNMIIMAVRAPHLPGSCCSRCVFRCPGGDGAAACPRPPPKNLRRVGTHARGAVRSPASSRQCSDEITADSLTLPGLLSHSPFPPAQPSNEAELCNAVATAVAIDDAPSALRFPRGNGLGVSLAEFGVAPNLKGTPWEVRPGSAAAAPLPGLGRHARRPRDAVRLSRVLAAVGVIAPSCPPMLSCLWRGGANCSSGHLQGLRSGAMKAMRSSVCLWRLQIGRGVIRRGGKDVALVGYGTMVNNALDAAELLAHSGVSATVADMRHAPFPLDCYCRGTRACVCHCLVGFLRKAQQLSLCIPACVRASGFAPQHVGSQ